MDLELTTEQRQLGESARMLLTTHSPLTRVRALEEAGEGTDSETWSALAATGLLGLGRGEEHGGVGGGLVELSVLHEELGRALAAGPYLESLVVGAGLLAGAGATPDLIRSVVDGSATAVAALLEPGQDWDDHPEEQSVTLTQQGLSGTKTQVPFAAGADWLIVRARDAAGELVLLQVPADDPSISRTALPNIAGVPLFAVTFDRTPAAAVLTRGEPAEALVEEVRLRAALLRAAQIVGAGERLRDMTVRYAQQRSQFGRPVGAYQAVQYLCSDIAIEAHLAAVFVRYAAGLSDAGSPSAADTALAVAQAKRAARRIAHAAHEVHAGFAFMVEADVQLFTRRLKHWELDLGDDRCFREAAADALWGASA